VLALPCSRKGIETESTRRRSAPQCPQGELRALHLRFVGLLAKFLGQSEATRNAICDHFHRTSSVAALYSQGSVRYGDWGGGCVRECSQLRCDSGNVWDWTTKRCSTCDALSDISLCKKRDTESMSLVQRTVTGNLPAGMHWSDVPCAM
jgi:hypothetical protein